MHFSITGLPLEPFRPLFDLSIEELADRHILRITADSNSGYPCRVLLEDAHCGDTLLLLNHEYQPAPTPYQGRHAIYVNQAALGPRSFFDEIPPSLASRPAIAVRAFDREGMMIQAEVVAGPQVAQGAMKLLGDDEVAYIQAHYAARGCFAARIDRVR